MYQPKLIFTQNICILLFTMGNRKQILKSSKGDP